MNEDFVAYLKGILDTNYNNYLNNRVATGNVAKDGQQGYKDGYHAYIDSIGYLRAFQDIKNSIDAVHAEFKKTQG